MVDSLQHGTHFARGVTGNKHTILLGEFYGTIQDKYRQDQIDEHSRT